MRDYPYTPLYYDSTTRVRFLNPNTGEYCIGFANEDYIIYEDKKLEIQDVIDYAEDCDVFFDDAIVELAW